jgi:hypothetical protein
MRPAPKDDLFTMKDRILLLYHIPISMLYDGFMHRNPLPTASVQKRQPQKQDPPAGCGLEPPKYNPGHAYA